MTARSGVANSRGALTSLPAPEKSTLGRVLDERDDHIAALENLLRDVGGDISEEDAAATIDAWLAEAETPLKQKLESYRAVYRALEASASFRRQEAQVRLDAAKRDEANMDRMKARLRYYFEAHGLERVDLPSGGRVSLVANGGKAPVVLHCTVDELPEWAKRVTVSADLEAVRYYLETSGPVDFAELGDRGKSLRIR